MLSALTQRQLESVFVNLPRIIEDAFKSYELKEGAFEVRAEKELYNELYLDLINTVFERIEGEQPIRILPFYNKLLFITIKLNFNTERFLSLLKLIEVGVIAYLDREGIKNTNIEQSFLRYIESISNAIKTRDIFLKGTNVDELIQIIDEYAPSTAIVDRTIAASRLDGRRVYSLFSKDFYWEYQKKQNQKSEVFSGIRKTVYNNKLYLLNQGIAIPSYDSFDDEEWGEYTSKYLIKSKTFNEKLNSNLKTYISNALKTSKDINSSISDSKVEQLESNITYDQKDLKSSFGGAGENVVENVILLKTILKYFGNSQASPVGSVDYISLLCEYLYAFCFGRKINGGFSDVGGTSLLGDFNTLFSYGSNVNKIAGLKFLEGFKSLKSFSQNLDLPLDIEIKEEKEKLIYSAIYNPIYAKYISGIKDRYIAEDRNPYIKEVGVDLILFGLETILQTANRLGDTIEAIKISLDQSGILPGYEGLGPISIQIEEFSKVFITTSELDTKYANSKILPGFNGLLKYLVSSYQKLSDTVIYPSFTSESLENFNEWGREVENALGRLISNIKNLGYSPGNFVPNISFKYSAKDREIVIDQLRSLNFQENEINKFLSVESFEELLSIFSPITDSLDQVSFFKGYELTQLIYEFGGESAVDNYLSYLYSQDENGLLRVLNNTLKNKNKVSIYNENRFGKLVGLLINLTFAIDPDQLALFKDYLSGSNLDLFKSIEFLLQNRNANILLDKDNIEILAPLVESLIYGRSIFGYNSYSIGYGVADREAPLALQQLEDLIDKDLGRASIPLLRNLFDKFNGLSVKELIKIIGPGSFNTEYGQLVNGYEGGKLTKLINYAYFSGLLHRISYYTNSYQVPNFYISPNVSIRLDQFLVILESIKDLLNIVLTNLSGSIEFPFEDTNSNLYSFENIFNTQNKKIEEISKIVRNLVPINRDISNIASPSINGEAIIVGAPGTGNSPIPESIPIENSITPEQASQLSTVISRDYSFISDKKFNSTSESDIINKFVKFIEKSRKISKLNSGQSLISENIITEENSNLLKNPTTTQEDKPLVSLGDDKNVEGMLPAFYASTPFSEGVEKDQEDLLVSKKLISKFDPLESCKKFGGENCEDRVQTNINTCGAITNSAIYPEKDTAPVSTVLNGSVPIDRPLGSSDPQTRLSNVFIPNGKNNKPGYFDLLGDGVKITTNSEPVRLNIDAEPYVFKKESSLDKEGLLSQYYSSEFGLIEAIKAGWEKDDPFNCSLLEDPYAYQACMNLLKCKKFKREKGMSVLKFCPKTLAGGLLK